MNLLLLSIAPGILICLFIYFKDRYNREPVGLLLMSFFLGVTIAIPCLFIETGISKWATGYLNAFQSPPLVHILIQSFAVIALTEESLKFLILRKFAFRQKQFDEPLDGIVYSVYISMGFATIENVGYVYMQGASTAVLRMFLSVPAHAAFAVLMGYYAGVAKFNLVKRKWFLLKGLGLAILFHGLYDSFLFMAESKSLTRYVSGGLLISGALFSYYVAVQLSLKAIRQQQKLSKLIHEKPVKLTVIDKESDA